MFGEVDIKEIESIKKVKIVTEKKNKHQVLAYNDLKWVLIKEFKTLRGAIDFIKKEGGNFVE